MSLLHDGQVLLTRSHSSTQLEWKWWPQGSTRNSSSRSKSEMQMGHVESTSPSSWLSKMSLYFFNGKLVITDADAPLFAEALAG
mmetsp:Transcript_18765/g.34229  ORF Transcript_18765/g.34229 Transcript_18765/m.34229 type:complete len:84 (-) Transcript_18765:536-787(-)